MDLSKIPTVTPGEKIAFSIITCTVLCLLFPVAAPLFMSFFLGVTVKEANLKHYVAFIEGPLLYGSTFFLGLLLGVLCEANTIMNPKILILLVLGILALLLSGIGGIIGGYLMYFISKGKFNPVVGIAGVSCIPTTTKVAQKIVSEENPHAIVIPYAIGANISGVITSAILAGIYVSLIPLFK
jgi:oxaloacetate decarboxylase beta subunit